MEIFSMRLKKVRLANNLTQQDLADKLFLSRSIICCYEKGTRMASIDTLIRISDIFDLNINYLIGREVSIVNKQKIIGSCSCEEYEFIKELRKFNKLYSLFINNSRKVLSHINKMFFS